VEQVSFADIRAFLRKLNARVEGLDLGLPSEAQWEYACRAGTTTATHAGDLRILGDNNAPVLDAIAWYGGNSGVGFELENGYDSSRWPGKQYEHTRAGTWPVAQKAANPWGLYDMLGNVWEWCADHWHDNYDGAPTDGSAWIGGTRRGGAAGRVVRGGSWSNDARSVRAAFRNGGVPARRLDVIGFRCARVQSDSVLSEAERRAGRSKPSERSETAATTSPERRERMAKPLRKRNK
jgi:formylglycine-generating enzyme required for sulfatase activity